MKKFILALAVICGVLSVNPAKAAITSVTTFGNVDPTFSYEATTKVDTTLLSALYTGSLSGMSKIVFTYSISPTDAVSLGSLTGVGYTVGGLGSSVSASVDKGGEPAISADGLLLATANLNASGSYGTVTITNLTQDLIAFQSSLVAILSKKVALTVTAVVTSVPLPAALPLLGLGLSALGFSSVRKRRQAG